MDSPPGTPTPPDLTSPQTGGCALKEGHRSSHACGSVPTPLLSKGPQRGWAEGSPSPVHSPAQRPCPICPSLGPELTQSCPQTWDQPYPSRTLPGPAPLRPRVVGPAPEPGAALRSPRPRPWAGCDILRGRWACVTLLNPQSREWTRASSPRSSNEHGGLIRLCLPHQWPAQKQRDSGGPWVSHPCQLSPRTPRAHLHHQGPEGGFPSWLSPWVYKVRGCCNSGGRELDPVLPGG